MPRIYNRFDRLEFRRELRQTSTKAERILWSRLRAGRFHGLKFRRQYSLGRFIADFYCPKYRLVIEVDGPSHLEQQQFAYDSARTEWLHRHFIRVIRFTNEKVLYQTEEVLECLRKLITSPHPSSREEGREGW